MIEDDSDTDFVCRTNVSAFALSQVKMQEVMKKRQDLREERKKVETELFQPKLQVALDYIFHNNNRDSME